MLGYAILNVWKTFVFFHDASPFQSVQSIKITMGSCFRTKHQEAKPTPKQLLEGGLTQYGRHQFEYDHENGYSYSEYTRVNIERVTITCENIDQNIEDYIKQFHTRFPRGDVNHKDYPKIEKFFYHPNLPTSQAKSRLKTEPSMILTVDFHSADIQRYQQALITVAKLLTGQRNHKIVQTVIQGFSREYNVPNDIIQLCGQYYSHIKSEAGDQEPAQANSKKVFELELSEAPDVISMPEFEYNNKAQKRAKERIKSFETSTVNIDKGNAYQLYVTPLALDWDKGGTADINKTVENVGEILYERIEESEGVPGWKCVLTRYNGYDPHDNHVRTRRYDTWTHADDNWYLWWMIQNDVRTEDQSECLVFRFELDCYEQQRY